MQKSIPVEVIVLKLALNHARAALGVLDRSDECPEAAAQLDLVVARLADEVKTRELNMAGEAGGKFRRTALRLASG